MTTQLSEFLPFIVAGLGIVLIGLWIWLVPSKGKPLPKDVEAAAAELEPPVADVSPKPPAAPVAAAKAVPKAKATPKAKPAAKAKAAPRAAKAKAAAPVADVVAPAAKAAPKPKAATKAKVEDKPKSPAKAKAEAVAKPAPKPKAPAKAKAAPSAPKAVAKPKPAAAGPDNLVAIKGLGPKLKTLLNDQGITRFDQIAAWTEADIAAIDAKLGAFAGRIQRDQFVAQARLLAAGDIAAFEAAYGKLDAPLT